ncbi:hypothetical protein IJ182_02315 [bacterium]|nr:hypothetical protein [bacterium]
MKKFFIIIMLSFLSMKVFASEVINTSIDITGRWAEQTSERVVMDIYPAKQDNMYKVFITWREDNLAQKDIYRFNANVSNPTTLKYLGGEHIIRSFDLNNKDEDKNDYAKKEGAFLIQKDKLVWKEYNDNSEDTVFIRANDDLTKDTTVKSKLFSITLPEELKGFYDVETEKDKISVYHKDSKAKGFGGFAFGIKAYRNPADHAVLPGSKKLGELTDKKGNLYDIVLKYPTDVQYDYTKSSKAPKSFQLLYDIGEVVNIKGINGSTYYKNQGVKGEYLYKDILKKHIIAIKEKWDSTKLENNNMSYMYNVISKTNKNPLNKIGYAYYDMNADGIDELVIGEISPLHNDVIYDIYTMVDRKPQHVVSGGTRNSYSVCDISFVCNKYSAGAMESGVRVYNLVENSTELYPQVSFKYDGYENPKNPYFISYSDEKWENVSKKVYDERKQIFDSYIGFNYKPLSGFEKKSPFQDRYNPQKDYFDYSVVLSAYPKNYYYTTVKINKSKERILIITDKISKDKTSNYGVFYYFDKNGFVYPLELIESNTPLSLSKNYFYYKEGNTNKKFYMSDKKPEIIKYTIPSIKENISNIKFETIESADKFAGDFGSPAGDDIKKISMEGFYFEYHKPQYKRKYIKSLMNDCIKDGVKTQVQMYCCVVKKLHP